MGTRPDVAPRRRALFGHGCKRFVAVVAEVAEALTLAKDIGLHRASTRVSPSSSRSRSGTPSRRSRTSGRKRGFPLPEV
jgi:hypothetical protein